MRNAKLNKSLRALVFSNLVPLFGALFLGWSVGSIIATYWLENVVIGFYNVLKMKTKKIPSLLVLFFIFHFGIFTLVHGVFVFILFVGGDFSFWALLTGFVSLIISHGISYQNNFLKKGEAKNFNLQKAMSAPYERILILHLVVILGGFFVQIFSVKILAVFLLVGLKTLVDIASHLLEHRNNNPKNKKRLKFWKKGVYKKSWNIEFN